MQDYIRSNKEAWEEAFDHRLPGWGENNADRLLVEHLPFFAPVVREELEALSLKGKSVAQFCCNNGRELLSLVEYGAAGGTGFDIVANILAYARETARKANIANCVFVEGNLLDIPAEYYGQFDFVFFTVGALTWFEDLGPVFRKAADCMKPSGVLLIHDMHPFISMLPAPGEDRFDETHLDRIAYPYFRKTPWLENDGMSYISGNYPSKLFTSFSHTVSHLLMRLMEAGFTLTKFLEFDTDVGLTDVYNGKGYPLSYLLTGKLEIKP